MPNHECESLFTEIEGANTSAATGLASGYRQFVSILRSLPAFRALLDLCKRDETIGLQVMKRALRLGNIVSDSRFENPLDAAIAAYLLVLEETHPRFASIASIVPHRAGNWWWAVKVADELTRVPISAAEREGTSIFGSYQKTTYVNRVAADVDIPTTLFSFVFGSVVMSLGISDYSATDVRTVFGIPKRGKYLPHASETGTQIVEIMT